jgi:hypothetical protein
MKRPHLNHHHLYDLCEKHMHTYVLAETVDGNKIDGIITGVDEECVYLAVPITGSGYRDYGDFRGAPGFGYPGYGYGFPGYGYGFPHRPRRFNRLILPLAGLTAISALPWY